MYKLIAKFNLKRLIELIILTGKNSKEVMTWNSRMKVAKGAARGLRYLHEDCRVGCIVHRDLRPNNILLTHDFEPMVSVNIEKGND